MAVLGLLYSLLTPTDFLSSHLTAGDCAGAHVRAWLHPQLGRAAGRGGRGRRGRRRGRGRGRRGGAAAAQEAHEEARGLGRMPPISGSMPIESWLRASF